MRDEKKKVIIIEQNLTGKHSQETCEDGIVVTDDFIAVIDGSTSKAAHQLSDKMRNGRLAMTLVKDVLESLPSASTLSDFCRAVTLRIKDVYERHHIDVERLKTHAEERLTASVVVYSVSRQEIWMIGDCQCLVDGAYYDQPKPMEAGIAAERSTIIHQMLASDTHTIPQLMTHDDGRDVIVGQIVDSCKWQNILFSVVDGFDIPLEKTLCIDASGCEEIVLASDGYPFLHPTLEETETALHRLLRDDPLCIDQYKATKGLMEGNLSFDDRAYIRLRII